MTDQIPTIGCFNRSRTPLGVEFGELIKAMQTYVDKCVAPVWGTSARLIRATGFVKNAWAMVFLDNADQSAALAHHDMTPSGLPFAKVFVRTTIDNGDLVSVSASHQLVEMLVDPSVTKLVGGPEPQCLYAYEVADPVEELSFNVGGIPMSDFVFPAYFDVFRKSGSAQFDHLNKVKKPFQILSGGYQIIYKNGKWQQIFGSASKEKSFAGEDRRGHRSVQRKLQFRQPP